MVPVSPSTWLDFYAKHREDTGAFQRLYEADLGTLATKTKTHLGNALGFTETIAGSAYGTVLLVPGPPGRMQVLHHGFTCSTNIGLSIIFIQGNLSDCSYFKVLPRELAIEQIRISVGGRTRSTNCPTLEEMMQAGSEEAFKALPAQGNGILRQFPNHLMINSDTFMMTDGATSISSKALAMDIINWFNRKVEAEAAEVEGEEEDHEREERLEYAGEMILGFETILAMLWASENDGLTPILLTDVDDDPVLNQLIRNIKAKLVVGTSNTNEGGPGPETNHAQATAFVLSSQSIVTELNRMHEDRTTERSLQESKNSLLKTMDSVQKDLFTSLSTTDLSIPPVMSTFMTTLTKSASPQKAIGLLKNRALDWEGSFSEGSCHRMLANGFLSLEKNRANPGGFTVFMFHPRTVDTGARTFDSDTATLRDYFGMDVEDSTVAFYAKQGFFHPTNSHNLRIQLQTALDMLELLTCENSIATKGLHYILNPQRWRRYSTEIHDRFLAEKSFGTKFLYSVDRTLQTFFRRLTRRQGSEEAMEGSPTFLLDHAVDLIAKLESGASMAVTLPASLMTRGRTDSANSTVPATKKAKMGDSSTPSTKKSASFHHHTETHTNTHVHASWLAPKGSDFLDLFKDRSPGTKPWPKLQDQRLPKKNRQIKSAPLCTRFQMTAKCTHGCQLAHVFAKDMSQAEFSQVDQIMKELLATKP